MSTKTVFQNNSTFPTYPTYDLLGNQHCHDQFQNSEFIESKSQLSYYFKMLQAFYASNILKISENESTFFTYPKQIEIITQCHL